MPAFAQTDRGNITGTVTDSSGGVIAGAQVTAKEAETGQERTTVTSARGDFTVPELPAGPYEVQVTAPGFKSTIKTVRLGVLVTQRLDVQLEVGSASQE